MRCLQATFLIEETQLLLQVRSCQQIALVQHDEVRTGPVTGCRWIAVMARSP